MINFLKVILVQQLATGHTQKSNTPDTNPDQISGQCALIFPFERGTSFTSDPHILYCTVNYCTKSLSLAKNHAHQSQTSSPVTTIAKRERSLFRLTTILNLMKLLSECTILITLFKASFNNLQSKMYMKYTVFN